jgi:hypothetical protein
MTPAMLPTPSQIVARFERGEIERDEFQALMALHARELIGEMEEDYQNPAAALLETLRARRLAASLASRHGTRLVREVLVALSEAADFPPSRRLWNASHPDVPLHCFFRIGREPVFRILELRKRSDAIEVATEHGPAGRGKATPRLFTLRRDRDWRLKVV